MADGDPSISLRGHHTDEGYFNVDTIEMTDEEVASTCDRLVGFLSCDLAEKAAMQEKYGSGKEADHRKVWLG